MPDSIKQLYTDIVRTNYAAYCQYVHEGRWIPAKHLLYLCKEIQRFIETPNVGAYDILIVQMPPQHGKSMTITETLPSWYLGRYPDHRIILASYNDDTAEKFTRRNKEKIRQFGKSLYNIEIGKLDRATDIELSNGVGTLISRGIMGGITSNPANLIIIDDPIKNRVEADSETNRKKIWDEWQNSIKTRLAAGAKVIIVMTRWHEDDLAGRVIANESHVKIINLPCEAEENDVLGRDVGQALFPEIGKDDEWLKDFKKSYVGDSGSMAWNALFQGRPTAAEGNLIKRDWWQFYEELPEYKFKVITVDATFKGLDTSDFVVVQAWAKHLAGFYLVDTIRAKMSFTETIKAIQTFRKKHMDAIGIYIEDKANGSAIIDVLSKSVSGVIAVQANDSKVVRAQSVLPLVEAKNVYLPKFEQFTQPFIDECAAFPNGAHDDQVDGMSMGLSILKNYIDEPIKPKIKDDFTFPNKSNVANGYMSW